MALRGTPPSTPKVCRGQLSPAPTAPPGLELPPGLPMLPPPQDAECAETLQQIASDVLQYTDARLQTKVDKMWYSAQQGFETFDRQQEANTETLEVELRRCREKVSSLEADKETMQQSLNILQAQMSAMSMQFGMDPTKGFTMPSPLMGTPPPPLAGNFMMAGMMSQYATFPSAFPNIPAFPLGTQTRDQEPTEVSEPGTPIRAPVAPPAMAPPPEPSPQKASTAISISEAIVHADTGFGTPKRGQAPCNSDMEALRIMMQDDTADKVPPQCLTPVRGSPATSKTLHGTPSRTMQASPNFKANLLASPSGTLNITPKRTPRSSGKMPQGMKSPSIMSSPFVICESGGYVFEFTLRLAQDYVVGINIEHSDEQSSLKVTGIVPGGAMEAWNRQCTGGPSAGKEVMVGDLIVKVNKFDKPEYMLRECREQKLLKFTVTRGNVDTDIDPLCMAETGTSRRSSIFASPKIASASQDFLSP